MSAFDGFKITASRIDNNNREFPEADAWQVKLTNPRGKTLSTKFYMGHGHQGRKPELSDVLDSLMSDASCVEYRSVEEFANDLGYEFEEPADIKRVTKIYNTCVRTAERLEKWMTEDEREAIYNEINGE